MENAAFRREKAAEPFIMNKEISDFNETNLDAKPPYVTDEDIFAFIEDRLSRYR